MRRLFIIFPLLCLFVGCHTPDKQSTDLLQNNEYIIIWKKNQKTIATPANIWHGFEIKANQFISTGKNPGFYFFLRSIPSAPQLTIDYRNPGKSDITMHCNQKLLAALNHQNQFHSIHSYPSNLKEGFNLISFKTRIAPVEIRRLSINQYEKENVNHLQKGDSLHLALKPGKIKINITCESRLHITFSVFDQEGNLRIKNSGEISIPPSGKEIVYRSSKHFLLETTCLGEDIKFNHLWYTPEKTERDYHSSKSQSLFADKPLKDIYIFLIDGCQAKHLSLYGYHRNTDEHLSRFASDSILFENAYTNATFTRSAVATLFTGLYPDHHGIRILTSKLDHHVLTLPEFLKTKGYNTAIFTAAAIISQGGFKQGVDHFASFYRSFQKKETHKIVEAFSQWVSRTASPRFAYIHIMEPHFPIIPPPPFKNKYKKNPRPKEELIIRQLYKKTRFTKEEIQDVIDDYDSCINYADSLFGKMLKCLKKKNLYKNSMIVFLSDHGEACYEHHRWGHGGNVLEETSHIPLVIKFPAFFNLKGKITEIVEIADIFPSIYQLMTGEKGRFDGEGFLELLLKNPRDPSYITVSRNSIRIGTYAVRWKKWYYIISMKNNREFLFNLKEDPLVSVADRHQSLCIFLRSKFLSWLRSIQKRSHTRSNIDLRSLTKEELENLKSLGYI